MVTIYQIIELFATLIEGMLVLSVSFRLSERKASLKRTIVLLLPFALIYTGFVALLNAWKVFSFITVTAAVAYTIAVTKLVSRQRLNLCFTSMILTWFFMNAIDYILLYSVLIFTGHLLDVTKGFELILTEGTNRTLFLFTDKLVQAGFVIGFGHQSAKLKTIGSRNINLLLILSIAAYIILNLLTALIVTDSLFKIQIAVILSFLFIVISLIAMIFVVSINSKYQNAKRERELMVFANTMTEQNFRQFEDSQKKIQQQVHDFKNHLIAIDALIQNELKAKAYVEELLSASYTYASLCHSGSDIIDAIINRKLEAAKTQSTNMEYSVQLNCPVHISSVDICAILSNQIDNALEACLKIPEKDKRWLRISIWQKESFLFFKVVNTTASNPFNKRQELHSSKDASTGLHGLGIKNIIETASKYGGTLKNDCIDGVFSSVVMLLNNE